MNKKINFKDENLEETLSFMRHELRTPLAVIREGVSQVLDGLGDNDCNKCTMLLTIAMESINKLNRLIKDIVASDYLESKLNIDTSILYKNQEISNDIESLKKDVLHMISHTVRTPLSIIKEGVSLVMDGTSGDINNKQKELLSAVKENIDRLISSTEDLLNTTWKDALTNIKAKP